MKNYYSFIFLLITSISFGQTENDTIHKSEAEMKSASMLMNFRDNPNTQNYDITYHKLEFTVNPTVSYISGIVSTTLTALSDLNTITFDLTNEVTVSSVTNGGTSLAFAQNTNNELVITMPTTQVAGTIMTLVITYAGPPADSGFDSFKVDTHNGSPILWTLSEPYGARDWWPCKQDLNDKVNSIDVYITAPSQYTSVSNGLEQSAIVNGATKTTHFHHGYPIPAYLIAIAVSNYQVYNQQGGLGTAASPYFPIVNYMFPETAAANQASLAPTPTIINFYETKFGPYPFRNEKYGHCQFGWGGGMEHTTVSFMTAGGSGGYSRSLIAHEMGHQWFGDKVTCGTWKDIWLNEGITEYLSGLVVENLDGAASFVAWKNGKIANITSQPGGNLYLTDTQLTNVNRIFSSRLTYDKGSMVTNMIRFKMGDTNFFQAMKNYLNDPALAYGYGLTPEFQAHLEAVSGIPFTEFFNDWVYNQGYPTYTINAQNIAPGQAKITVDQSQSHSSVSFFEMPLPVRLTGSGGQSLDVLLDNTSNGQEFTVAVPFTVTGVQFDPNKNIISANNDVVLDTISFALQKNIKIHPNPTSNILNIEMPTGVNLEKVIVYNALGQTVLEKNTNAIVVSQLSTGVHFIKIITSEGTIHKKFIKE
ncbi:MAG: M1 family aminopeptidase [Bacteroidota bacterium]